MQWKESERQQCWVQKLNLFVTLGWRLKKWEFLCLGRLTQSCQAQIWFFFFFFPPQYFHMECERHIMKVWGTSRWQLEFMYSRSQTQILFSSSSSFPKNEKLLKSFLSLFIRPFHHTFVQWTLRKLFCCREGALPSQPGTGPTSGREYEDVTMWTVSFSSLQLSFILISPLGLRVTV